MKKLVSSMLLVGLMAGAVPAASSCAMPTGQGESSSLSGVLSSFPKADRAGSTEEGRPLPEAVADGSYLATRCNEKASDDADASMRAKAWNIRQDLYERFGYVRDGLLALQVAYAKNRHYTVRQKLERAMELNKYMEERLNRVYQDTLKGLEVDLDKEEKSMKESFDRSAFWVDNAARMFEHCQYTH